MASSFQRRPDAKDPRSLMDAVKKAPDRNLDPHMKDAKQALEKVEEKAELSQDVAAQLQSAMGNSALQGMLKHDTSTASADNNALEAQQEQEEEKEVEGDEKETESGEMERVLPSFGHAGGGGAGGSPYDVGRFFGGDDDGDATVSSGSGPRWRPMPSLPDPDEDIPLEEENEEESTHSEEELPFEEADARLGDIPVPVTLLSRGLRYTRRCALPDFSAEKLADLYRLDNAYGRGTSLLHFLARHIEVRDARILAKAAAFHSAASEKMGFSGAIAHVLATCELILRMVPDDWEPVLEASLDAQTRPSLDNAASELAPQGKLTAPALLEEVTGESWEPDEVEFQEESHPAAFAALKRACALTELPALEVWQPLPKAEAGDAQLEAMDRMFDQLLAGEAPAEGITEEELQRLFESMNALLGTLGQAQAEVASAGLVVIPWSTPGYVAGICSLFDGLLKRAARRLVRVGRELEGLVGTEDRERVTALSAEAAGVRGSAEILRQAAFFSFASVLRTGEPSPEPLPDAWQRAEAAHVRSKTEEAREILEKALDALEENPGEQARLSLLAGSFLLERGFGGAAEVHLDWASTLLESERPELAAGAILMELSLHLNRDWKKDAKEAARRLLELGKKMKAPYVVAAAAIAEATATRNRRVLEETAEWMREEEAGGALNLLKGRWVEMSQMKPESKAPPPIDFTEEPEETVLDLTERVAEEGEEEILLL